MASKKILLLLSSDRYAGPLIHYLLDEGKRYGWKTRIGCMFDPQIGERVRTEKFAVEPEFLFISKMQECDQAIRKSDIVVGMVSDTLLLQIADSCICYRKTLVSPLRLTRQMALKKTLAKDSDVLVLLDCGFSPGLDHITAKKAIDNIHSKGGKISSFRTCSGGFIPVNAEDNPWGFKFSEPAADLFSSARQTNRHLINGHLQNIPSHALFQRGEPLDIPGSADSVLIPEGDSLYFRKVYGLMDAGTVIKGRIFPAGFERMWDLLIRLGLTDPVSKIDLCGENSFYNLLDSLLPYSPAKSIEDRLQEYCQADSTDIEKLKWLGLFDENWVQGIKDITPALVLECLIDAKLSFEAHDRDRIVMQHQLGYEFRDEHYEFSATLISMGENMRSSALARAIGYTCGAAAKSVLLGNIGVKGIHIPVIKEIYDPVLNELEDLEIAFHIEDNKMQPVEIPSAL